MKEIWKDIPNYEGLYQASNLGGIKSITRKIKNKGTYGGYCTYNTKILKQHKDNLGYYVVTLAKNGKIKRFRVHRLIALVFLENKNNYKEINHKDGNKGNNNANNLEWCTHKHNIKEAWKLGLIKAKIKTGKEHHRSKPIIQYNINNKKIREWENARQIEKELGICNQNISKCCKGKYKTAGGYIWKYKN